MALYYMLNKPSGFITAKTDANRPTVMECFPPGLREAIHPVGRLDRDTEGLLIFTDDGRVDRALMPPERRIEKKYFFRAFGSLNEDDKARFAEGIPLFGSGERARPALLELCGVSTVGEMSAMLPAYRKGKYLRNPEGETVSGCVTVTEGKKHEVKLMLRSAGCKIFYLKRLSIGGIKLGDSLLPGEYRALTSGELEMINLERLNP